MEIVLLFLGIALLSSLTCRNAALGMIPEIGRVARFYPKHYVSPPRWFRKCFDVRQSAIPRFLAAELWLSLLFAALGPINAAIAAATGFHKTVVGILVMIHVCLILAECAFSCICFAIYRRGNTERK